MVHPGEREDVGSLATLGRRGLWALRRALSELDARGLESYHHIPDVHNVERNGDARLRAVAVVIAARVGAYDSLLELGCGEGHLLRHLVENTAVRSAAGVDAAPSVLARARARCAHLPVEIAPCDLGPLYREGVLDAARLRPSDVVVLAEVLYYLGPRAHWRWAQPAADLACKTRFVVTAAGLARQALIVQHFGARERPAIARVMELCGGELVDARWGIYVVPGRA